MRTRGPVVLCALVRPAPLKLPSAPPLKLQRWRSESRRRVSPVPVRCRCPRGDTSHVRIGRAGCGWRAGGGVGRAGGARALRVAVGGSRLLSGASRAAQHDLEQDSRHAIFIYSCVGEYPPHDGHDDGVPPSQQEHEHPHAPYTVFTVFRTRSSSQHRHTRAHSTLQSPHTSHEQNGVN